MIKKMKETRVTEVCHVSFLIETIYKSDVVVQYSINKCVHLLL